MVEVVSSWEKEPQSFLLLKYCSEMCGLQARRKGRQVEDKTGR